jgi:hypothetical protein
MRGRHGLGWASREEKRRESSMVQYSTVQYSTVGCIVVGVRCGRAGETRRRDR